MVLKKQSSVFWLESQALSATDALLAAAAAVAFLDETTAKVHIHIGLGLRCLGRGQLHLQHQECLVQGDDETYWLLGDKAFQRDGLHWGLLLGRRSGRHSVS